MSREELKKTLDMHPGRGRRSAPIACCLCSWSPLATVLGGVRWKLLAQHYERHLDELTAPTPKNI